MYTKGEWKALYAGTGQGWYIDAPDREVAKVLDYSTSDPKITEANAQLIASAPDLYEACKLAMEFFGCNPEIGEDYPKLVKPIEQALAKAEGR